MKRLFTLSEFYDRDRRAFDAAMDLTGWLEFFVEGLSTQMSQVKQRGERVIRRDVLARRHGLNERQPLAVEGLFEVGRSGSRSSIPGVHRRTLQRDLQGLVARGIAIAEGAARATRYSLSDTYR